MLDPYTTHYQQIKNTILSGTSLRDGHEKFIQDFQYLFNIDLRMCVLDRMKHNGRLRLELIVFDYNDELKLTKEDWRENDLKFNQLIRELYFKNIVEKEILT